MLKQIKKKVNLWLKNDVGFINLSKKSFQDGFVYVLLLQDNKIYVGFSKNPKHRIKSHFFWPEVSFLRKYPPTDIIMIKVGGKDFEEHLTKLLMKEYGWKNVRGGGYTQLNLPKPKFICLEE